MCITATFELYPTHCSLPTVTPHKHTGIVFNKLIQCIAPLPRATKRRMLTKIIHTITAMAATTTPHNADAQGDTATNTPGTDTIFVLTHDQIKQIPRDCTVTYTQIVVNYRPQISDPNRVRLSTILRNLPQTGLPTTSRGHIHAIVRGEAPCQI